MDNTQEYLNPNVVSSCCGAPMFEDVDICPECKEHCNPICLCEICEGEGKVNGQKCEECDGWGYE